MGSQAAATPVLALLAHVDTAQDEPGGPVRPLIHRAYDGSVITLPGDPTVTLDPARSPALRDHVGHDLISSDGTTLLGSDDKAGCAVIMQLVEDLLAAPSRPRPPIRICFTVDEEIGHTEIVRYTTAQDAGKAIHPSYVEGQMQGGDVQGIGWALNEEYVYGEDGRLQNTGFLDYRMPVASAQVKSCVLLAGLYANGMTCVTEPASTRDHTERMLNAFGCKVERKGAQACLQGPATLRACDIDVPADISSAAFFLVGASIAEGSDVILRQLFWIRLP